MEELKRGDAILEPDERQAFFSMVDPATGTSRPLTLSDLHTIAASITLHDGVPEPIRNHFATATNLLVYAWFYYPFNVTARFLSMVSIEAALRERFTDSSTPLKYLVQRAVNEGLIKDEGFSHSESLHAMSASETSENARGSPAKRYVDTLVEVLPRLRNDLAHGAHMIHPNSARSVQVAADFINQLFDRPNP